MNVRPFSIRSKVTTVYYQSYTSHQALAAIIREEF